MTPNTELHCSDCQRAANTECVENDHETVEMNAEGEWRVVHDAKTSHPDNWHIRDGYNGDCLAHAGTERIAAQIVSDHKAAKSQALLVEALREITARAQFALTTPGFIKGRDELQKAVGAALKAAGVEK